MKKALLLVAALAIGGAAFAQNKTKGLDIHFGVPVGITTWNISKDIAGQTIDTTVDWADVGFQLKLATYDGFLANDIIGLYASVGMNVGSMMPPYAEVKVNGNKIGENSKYLWDYGPAFAISGEFMIGSSFGANMGSVRFQTGVAFHAIITSSYGKESKSGEWNGLTGTMEYESEFHSAALGLALTPQFRFLANKKCSFIIGADLVFDFPVSGTYTITTTGKNNLGSQKMGEVKYDLADVEDASTFRFGITPYLGLGINF